MELVEILQRCALWRRGVMQTKHGEGVKLSYLPRRHGEVLRGDADEMSAEMWQEEGVHGRQEATPRAPQVSRDALCISYSDVNEAGLGARVCSIEQERDNGLQHDELDIAAEKARMTTTVLWPDENPGDCGCLIEPCLVANLR